MGRRVITISVTGKVKRLTENQKIEKRNGLQTKQESDASSVNRFLFLFAESPLLPPL
ncbi:MULTISPECIES: hypothetical protein [Prevotellaceae]|uniref:hypothetical protein n=1 Tax=Prevotellaceae TaxID=171552 RepID=UPI0003D362C1|nr:hypothetical protein [Prevotella phocaeensis]ETD18540.1 hypothetical protein HMPREF1199_01358 [Hoylesella oralis CC98A]